MPRQNDPLKAAVWIFLFLFAAGMAAAIGWGGYELWNMGD